MKSPSRSLRPRPQSKTSSRKPTRGKETLQNIYQILFKTFGRQHWWPGETPFEVTIGAILTQNTNWGNVEKAIHNLKSAGVLNPTALYELPQEKLAQLIRPAGYFNIKAKRLKNFLTFLFQEYNGQLSLMKEETPEVLRPKLLAVNGIGEETADSILLYALGKPIFVVDAYTKRFLYRHNMVAPAPSYREVQTLFMEGLPKNTKAFNEYHALIVKLAKVHCKTKPRCEDCPLKDFQYSLTRRCRQCFRSFLSSERPVVSAAQPALCHLCQRNSVA